MKHFHTKFRRLILLQSLLFALFLSPKSSTAAITPSLVPARTTGVAPLSVFFDASGTTDTAYTTRPFHDLEYTWNFGDANAGTWANGAQPGVNSKNTATGPVAAHIFETPGTYTVTLTVFNGTETVIKDTTITVDDPDVIFSGTNTICFSNTSDFTGCPAGAQQVTTANFTTAINTYQATGKRLLFKKGDTFTATTGAVITATGPGTIGAFGSGYLPIVQATINGSQYSNNIILTLSSPSTPNIKDWRIMDLEFDGSLIADSGKWCWEGTPLPLQAQPSHCNRVRGIGAGGINQVTMLRLSMHDMHGFIGFAPSGLDVSNNHSDPAYHGHTLWDQITIANSTLLRSIGGGGSVGIGIAARRLSLLGNIVDDSRFGEQVVRLFYVNKGILSNNTFSRQAPSKSVIKLHSTAWIRGSGNYLTDTLPRGVAGDVSGYTEQVILSDNKIVSADTAAWTVTISPQNIISDERLRNIIVERNWFAAGKTTETALVVGAAEVTIRNNICDMSTGRFLRVQLELIEPPPTDVRIYNNTAYSASTGGMEFIRIDNTATNVTVQNNLSFAPYATDGWAHPTMLNNGTGASGFIQSNNSAVTPVNQIKNTFPNWVSSNPSNPIDFKLTDSSYAINAGVQVPGVFRDFSNNLRTGTPDMGAFEWKCYSPSAQTLSVCAGQAVTVGVNTYTASGTYTDLLLTASGCDSIVSTSLTVNGVDTATSTSGATITASATGATYQWIDCDNANAAIAGATNQTYTVTTSGSYAVIVTQNNCSDTSACITVNATSAKEIISAKSVSVYPNPSNGKFKIELELNAKAQIIICNTLGETIYNAQAHQGKQEINISDFANGIYMLKVFNNEQQQYVRIVKQ